MANRNGNMNHDNLGNNRPMPGRPQGGRSMQNDNEVEGDDEGMSGHHHANAAFHYETAAHHHREAAEHTELGNHEEAERHHNMALDHGDRAQQHSDNADRQRQRLGGTEQGRHNNDRGSSVRGSSQNRGMQAGRTGRPSQIDQDNNQEFTQDDVDENVRGPRTGNDEQARGRNGSRHRPQA